MGTGVIKFCPGLHVHYDFGDPSVNMPPQVCSMFIVAHGELAVTVAMNLLGSAELIIVRRS